MKMHKSDALSQLRKLRMEIIKSMNGDDIILPTFEELKREFTPESLDKYDRIPTHEELIHKFGPQTEIVPPIDLEGMGARTLVFNFGLAVSHGFGMHHNTVAKQLNKLITKGIKCYCRRYNDRYSMLVSGTIFSDKLLPFWEGFQSLKSTDNNPFDIKLLKSSKIDNKSTLYEKIVLLVRQTHTVIEKVKKQYPDRANGVEGKIVIVTDNVNDLNILGDSQIYSLIDTFAPTDRYGRRKINVILAYILTEDGVNEKTYQIAKEIGVKLVDFYYWTGLYGRYDDGWYWLDSMIEFNLFEHAMTKFP